MTKEELKQEAEDYVNHNDWFEFSANVDKIGNAIKTKMERAYIAGAEPREKRIAELIALINAERERQEKCDDVHLRKIAELEKENAELKAKNKWYSEQVCNKECAEVWSNLTKAKELLRYYFDCFKNDNKYTLSDFEVVEDTEQFLKGE